MFKMFFVMGDRNPMIRACKSSIITPSVLAEIHRECMIRFESSPPRFKPSWYRMAQDAEALMTFGKVPEGGKCVIGPFVGRDVTFGKPGQIARLNAGIQVYSDLPDLLGKPHHERMSREVRISAVSAGFANMPQGEVVDPMVHWDLGGRRTAWTSVANILEKGVTVARESSKSGAA